MTVENNLPFLTERINEIKSAIFYSQTSELIKIPVSIISILRTDDSGWLWFFVTKPQQSMTEHEKSFPAHMQFYRKGKPFYIHVSGCAVIAEEKELINEFAALSAELKDVAIQNLSLIKLKMAKVEYYEHTHEITNPVVSKGLLKNLFTTIFKPSRYHRPVKLSVEFA